MKLTKDHLIEGQIIKAGTEVKIKEGFRRSDVDRYYSLVADLKRASGTGQYSEAGSIEKEIRILGGSLQKDFDRSTFSIPCTILDGVNRGYEKDFPAKYEVRAWNPAYDIVIRPIFDTKLYSNMYNGTDGTIEGHKVKVMDRLEAWSAYDSLSR